MARIAAIATLFLLFAGCGADAPQVNGLSPSSGPISGGTTAQLFGRNFSKRVQVFVGGEPATNVAFVGSGVLTVVVPPGFFPAPVSVTVVNTDGKRGHLTNGFTYTASPAPIVVSSVTPASGSAGTAVTIMGQGFEQNATVTFGGVAATSVNVQSPSVLTAIVPTGGGVVDVKVTNTDAGTGTLTAGYTFTGAASRVITTLVGNGTAAFGGDGGPASAASLDGPQGVAVAPDGTIYVGDTLNNRVRVLSLQGTISTFAGTGTPGFTGDNGAPALAQLNHPEGIAVDSASTVYIADTGNNVIRAISGGVITTIAGSGVSGFSGDGAIATAARLMAPAGIAVDASRDIFVADTGNHRIRRVDGVSHIISTIAGNGTPTFSGDAGPAIVASLSSPSSVTIDAQGNVFIADGGNARVRKVDRTAIITTTAGGGSVQGDGGLATLAQLGAPSWVAFDGNQLLIADATANRVRIVAGSTISTLAGTGVGGSTGDGGLAAAATLNGPRAVAVSAPGIYLIADTGNSRVRRVQ